MKLLDAQSSLVQAVTLPGLPVAEFGQAASSQTEDSSSVQVAAARDKSQ